MKAAPLIPAVVLAAALASAPPAPGEPLDGVVHLGCNAEVRALAHTGGELWIGTSDGVYRYDLGSDQFVDHLEAGTRLPSNSVRTIRAKGDSVLVGTDGGLAIYRGDEVTIFTDHSRGDHDSLTFHQIRSLDVGRRGEVFIGTFGAGVGVMRDRGGRAYTRSDSLLDNKVYGVLETPDDARYFATSMGLCAYRDSAWVGFQAGAGIPRGEVRAILDAGDGRMILLVGVGGVYRFDGQRASRLSPAGLFTADDIAALAMDERGALWAAGRFGGIGVYRGGRWSRALEKDDAAGTAPWRTVSADGAGAVFFGSSDGRVAMIRDNVVRWIRLPDALPSGSVRAITAVGKTVYFLSGPRVMRAAPSLERVDVDDAPEGLSCLAAAGDSALWAAGTWGVFERRAQGYREFRGFVTAPDPAFTALAVDARGRVWTALRNGAVYRYDGELWARMAGADELFGGAVDGLVAGDRAMWAFRRESGVARFDRVEWKRDSIESFGGEAVRDLAVSAQGAVVVATARRLWLFRADSTRWEPAAVGEGAAPARPFAAPRGQEILCVAFDSGGNMYLGTEGGLGLVGAGGVRWLDAADGLGGGAVIDVFVDGEAVWIGFRDDGISRIPRNSLW